MARKIPLYRRGMVGAVLFFGTVSMAGIGWALHSGAPSPANPYSVGRLTLPTQAATSLLSSDDYSTLRQANHGAIVGYGTALGGDLIELDGRRFRLWGIRAYRGPRRCTAGADISCEQTPLSVLQRWVNGSIVACYPKAAGLFGDEAAQCFRGREDLAGIMVMAGMASTVPSETRMYELSLQSAKTKKLGYWFR